MKFYNYYHTNVGHPAGHQTSNYTPPHSPESIAAAAYYNQQRQYHQYHQYAHQYHPAHPHVGHHQQGLQGSPQKVLTPPSSPLVHPGLYHPSQYVHPHQMSPATAAALMPSPPILTSLSKSTSSSGKTTKTGMWNLVEA